MYYYIYIYIYIYNAALRDHRANPHTKGFSRGFLLSVGHVECNESLRTKLGAC